MSAPTPAQDISPSVQLLVQAAKLAMQQDKPIQLDYFLDTYNTKAFMGEDKETKEKMLVRSEEEYTSLVQGMWRAGKEAGNDFIVMTENSIYIISGNTRKKTISAPTA
jgi:hypothetical protein